MRIVFHLVDGGQFDPVAFELNRYPHLLAGISPAHVAAAATDPACGVGGADIIELPLAPDLRDPAAGIASTVRPGLALLPPSGPARGRQIKVCGAPSSRRLRNALPPHSLTAGVPGHCRWPSEPVAARASGTYTERPPALRFGHRECSFDVPHPSRMLGSSFERTGFYEVESDPSATGHIFWTVDRNHRLTSSGVSSFGIVCAQYDAHTQRMQQFCWCGFESPPTPHDAGDLRPSYASNRVLAATIMVQWHLNCADGQRKHRGWERTSATYMVQTPATLWFK